MDQFTLEICKNYWTREGCRERLCQRLHLCRFYLTYRCEGLNKSGRRCFFSHSLKDEHNILVLEKAGRVNMTIHELKAAYRAQTCDVKAFRAKSSIPEVCKFYNGIKGGCKHDDTWDSGCPCLHICRHYVLGDCKFGNRCKYCHSINNQQPQGLLKTYGINIFPYNEREVLDKIKDRMLEVEDHELSVNVISEGKKLIKKDDNFSRNEVEISYSEQFIGYNPHTVRSSSPKPFYKSDPYKTLPFNLPSTPSPAFNPLPKHNILQPEVLRFLQNIPKAFGNLRVGRNEVNGTMNTGRNQHYPDEGFGINQHYPRDERCGINTGRNQHYSGDERSVHIGRNQHYPGDERSVIAGINQHYPGDERSVIAGRNQHYSRDVSCGINTGRNQHYPGDERSVHIGRNQHYPGDERSVHTGRNQHYPGDERSVHEGRNQHYPGDERSVNTGRNQHYPGDERSVNTGRNQHYPGDPPFGMSTERKQRYSGDQHFRNNMTTRANQSFTSDTGANRSFTSDGHDNHRIHSNRGTYQHNAFDGHRRKRGNHDDNGMSNGYIGTKRDVQNYECLFEHTKRLRFSFNF